MQSLFLSLILSAQPMPFIEPVQNYSIAQYKEAWNESVKTRKPLIIFVNVPYREIPGCIVVNQSPLLINETKSYIVVGIPYPDGTIDERAKLSSLATNEEIINNTRPIRQVQVMPIQTMPIMSSGSSRNC